MRDRFSVDKGEGFSVAMSMRMRMGCGRVENEG